MLVFALWIGNRFGNYRYCCFVVFGFLSFMFLIVLFVFVYVYVFCFCSWLVKFVVARVPIVCVINN